MRMRLAVVFGIGLIATVAGAQAPAQLQIFAGVLDAGGAPAAPLAVGDVRVMENGVDATVTKIEALDWPVKLQLLLDNGTGLGGGNIEPLKTGVQALLATLPANHEVTIVGTSPQPRFLTRATSDRAAM